MTLPELLPLLIAVDVEAKIVEVGEVGLLL
jgi:hypothetical protein